MQPMQTGKVAVVTGAGSGIGKATALVADGWQVVLASRRARPLDEVRQLAQERHQDADRVLALPIDVTDAAAVQQLFARTVAHFSRVDLLFNKAGRGNPAGSFLD